jgi:predicted Zn finger-like uncharacterized protein
MTIALSCPACKQALKVKDELAGRKVKCPKCGSVIAVAGAPEDREVRITAKETAPRVPHDEEEGLDQGERPKRKKKKKAKSSRGLLIGAAAGAVLLVAVVALIIVQMGGGGTNSNVAQKKVNPAPRNVQQANAPNLPEEAQPEKKRPVGAAARTLEVTKIQNALRQLGQAYRTFEVDKNRGPKSQQELGPYYQNISEINDAFTEKKLTFIWGASRQSLMENGDSNTVLAYETDADYQGMRMVLFGDGSVRGLNEEEFRQAPKAKGK